MNVFGKDQLAAASPNLRRFYFDNTHDAAIPLINSQGVIYTQTRVKKNLQDQELYSLLFGFLLFSLVFRE